MSKERFEDMLRIASPYSNEDLVFAFRDKQAWLTNRITDSLRMEDSDAQQRYRVELRALEEAYRAFAPKESLPAQWIPGKWGEWSPWVDNQRNRTRLVSAQGNPTEAKPDSMEVQTREPHIPLPVRFKAGIVQAIQATPAVVLLVVVLWLLYLHIEFIREW